MFCLDKLHVETALSTTPQMLLAFWEIVGRIESCGPSPFHSCVKCTSVLQQCFNFFPLAAKEKWYVPIAPFIHLDGIPWYILLKYYANAKVEGLKEW